MNLHEVAEAGRAEAGTPDCPRTRKRPQDDQRRLKRLGVCLGLHWPGPHPLHAKRVHHLAHQRILEGVHHAGIWLKLFGGRKRRLGVHDDAF